VDTKIEPQSDRKIRLHSQPKHVTRAGEGVLHTRRVWGELQAREGLESTLTSFSTPLTQHPAKIGDFIRGTLIDVERIGRRRDSDALLICTMSLARPLDGATANSFTTIYPLPLNSQSNMARLWTTTQRADTTCSKV
jgi:hypothetical protein